MSLCAYLHAPQRLDVSLFRTWVGRGCPSPSHPSIGAGIASPQTRWLDDRTNTVLYDYADEELPGILQHIGEEVLPIRRTNGSNRERDWQQYYDDETRLAVSQTFASDFELGLWSTQFA